MNERYRYLKQQLNDIHSRIRSLRDYDSSLKQALNENILFNDRNPVKDKMSSIRNSISDIDETLVYDVIPRVERKIK